MFFSVYEREFLINLMMSFRDPSHLDRWLFDLGKYDVSDPEKVRPILVKEALQHVSGATKRPCNTMRLNFIKHDRDLYCYRVSILNLSRDLNLGLTLVPVLICGPSKTVLGTICTENRSSLVFNLYSCEPLPDPITSILATCSVGTFMRAFVGVSIFDDKLRYVDFRLLGPEPSSGSRKFNPEQQGVLDALRKSRYSFNPSKYRHSRFRRSGDQGAIGDVVLLHGPPGTGKTYTLVEAIKQAVEDGYVVMACGPTHDSVKNFAQGLISSRVEFKIIGHKSDYAGMSKRVSNNLAGVQVVLGTFAAMRNSVYCNLLRRGEISPPSFVVIDEAAQAGPLFYAALSHIQTLGLTQLLFAGDHAQLPFLANTNFLGAEMSYLQRMDTLHPEYIHRLRVQYRMAPTIRQLVSSAFYSGTLTDERRVRGVAISSRGGQLPAVCNIDVKDGVCTSTAPSFYNEQEAQTVLSFLVSLDLSRLKKVFILTPYLSQANYIRERLGSVTLRYPHNITVSSIDGVQGQEADIVILSMVRTGALGFADNTNRMCVAWSRAISLLCVICHNYAFQGVPHFQELFESAHLLRPARSVSSSRCLEGEKKYDCS